MYLKEHNLVMSQLLKFRLCPGNGIFKAYTSFMLLRAITVTTKTNFLKVFKQQYYFMQL